jgi:hypothetical protein
LVFSFFLRRHATFPPRFPFLFRSLTLPLRAPRRRHQMKQGKKAKRGSQRQEGDTLE